MVKSAVGAVMVLVLQPLFMQLSRIFVERFLEMMDKILMKVP